VQSETTASKGFHESGEAIPRVPENRGFNQMHESAGQNEDRKQREDRHECAGLLVKDEVQQQQRNCRVRRKNGDIGNDVHPSMKVTPLTALPAFWEVLHIKQRRKECQHHPPADS
jgi:hypothetical protein